MIKSVNIRKVIKFKNKSIIIHKMHNFQMMINIFTIYKTIYNK